MGYTQALEAAGAKLIDYDSFGDLQGTWLALVDYNGQRVWIRGGYGSCSACDAFKAAFSDINEGCSENDHDYEAQEGCETCKVQQQKYQQELADFGKRYMTGNEWTQDEMVNELVREVEENTWDDKPVEMLNFVLKHDPQGRTIESFNIKKDEDGFNTITEEDETPEFSEADKTRLKGLGVQGSKLVQ